MPPLELLSVREDLGLTRETLAAALGVSLDSVASWELGRRAITDGVRRNVEAPESYTTGLTTALPVQLTHSTTAPQARPSPSMPATPSSPNCTCLTRP